MSPCPACAQLVSAETKRCPACGNDLRERRLATVRPAPDEELDVELLIGAAIAETGTGRRPPPLVPSLQERMRGPDVGDHPRDRPLGGPTDAAAHDLLPAGTPGRRPFFRRR
jgi:hypothetical protein